MLPLVIAIDGPAGAGKSTISKKLAEKLGYELLDTGAIYRAVAWQAKEQGLAWSDESKMASIAEHLEISFSVIEGINSVSVSGHDVSQAIRTPDISKGASIVSAHPMVRSALLSLQRRLGSKGGVVTEGRDIGTVVFPDADIKFFLTASSRERAKRRTAELEAQGGKVEFDSVLKEINARDKRDSSRDVAPLKAAYDAVHVDSSSLSLDEVLDLMLSRIDTKLEELAVKA